MKNSKKTFNAPSRKKFAFFFELFNISSLLKTKSSALDSGDWPSGKASRLGGTFGNRYNGNMFHVYILQSEKDKHYYIGQTNNIEKRLIRHKKGQVQSTKSRLPLQLIHQEAYNTRTEAMKREKYLKSLKSGNEWKTLLTQWGLAKW